MYCLIYLFFLFFFCFILFIYLFFIYFLILLYFIYIYIYFIYLFFFNYYCFYLGERGGGTNQNSMQDCQMRLNTKMQLATKCRACGIKRDITHLKFHRIRSKVNQVI